MIYMKPKTKVSKKHSDRLKGIMRFSKKILISTILLLSCTMANAYDIEVDGIYYNVNASDFTCEITNNGENSYSGDIYIPKTVIYKNKTLNVTSIGHKAFYNCTDLTSISIGSGISQIRESAFYGCNKLTSITIPFNVTKIEDYAFDGCNSLKELIIEDGLETLSLGKCSFSHTYNGWTSTYTRGLFYFNPIEALYLGRNIKCEQSPFYNNLYRDGNKSIKTVVIGNSVKSIERYTFYGCSGLTSAIIGNNVNHIEETAFANCENLKNIFYTSMTPPTSLWIVPNTYVPNIEIYSNAPVSSGNKIYMEEYITFGTDSITYGNPINFTWSNNIESLGYKASAPQPTLSLNAGIHTVNIPFTFFKGESSFNVNIPYIYTIQKAPLIVKADSITRLYGENNPHFTISYRGFINGEDESVLTNKGNATTLADIKSDVGNYDINVSEVIADNYEAQYETGTICIQKAPLIVTVHNTTKIYGDDNPSFPMSYSGLKNNETAPEMVIPFEISTDATKTSNVGKYDIKVSGGETKNYEITDYILGNLIVKKAPLAISADNSTKIYGDDNPKFVFSCMGLKNDDVKNSIFSTYPILSCSATNESDAGDYDITISGGDAYNYEITSYTKGTLNITKAPLTLALNNYIKIYGDENPMFEYTCIGLRNNDNLYDAFETEPQIVCSATKTSAVGEYDINIIGGVAKNYEISNSVKGVLTIMKAQITAIANNLTRVYGDDNPEYTLTYHGLKNDETSPEMITAFDISTDATKTSNVGEYNITVSGGVARNYEVIDYINGKLKVLKAPLVVTALNLAKIYGDFNPEYKYSCSGVKNNDNENAIFDIKPTLSCIADEKSNTGEYNIEISGASSKNYDISYKTGVLSVNKREITISTKDYTRIYGEDNPAFEILYNGFVNNDDENSLMIKPQINTSAKTNSDVGVYDIIIEGADDENYSFVYNNGRLTIEKAYQTIIWEQEFDNLEIGSQIELTAKASSGLDIEYLIPDNNFISMYTIGDITYLDCYDTGEIAIRAIQNGNKNYNAAVRVSKIIKVMPTSISSISSDTKVKIDGNNVILLGANNSTVRIYNIAGELVVNINNYSGEKITLNKGSYIINIGKEAIKVIL